jgi:hypothetical protein
MEKARSDRVKKWAVAFLALDLLAFGVWRGALAAGLPEHLESVPVQLAAPDGIVMEGFEVATQDGASTADLGLLLLGGTIDVGLDGTVANWGERAFDGGFLRVEFIDEEGETLVDDSVEMLAVPPLTKWTVGTGQVSLSAGEARNTRSIRLTLVGPMNAPADGDTGNQWAHPADR